MDDAVVKKLLRRFVSLEAVQQPKVAARDPDDRRDCFRVQRLLAKMHAGRRPTLVQLATRSRPGAAVRMHDAPGCNRRLDE